MDDPVIDEVRRVRRQISSEIGPELNDLVARYAKLESRFAHAPLTPSCRQSVKPARLPLAEVAGKESN